MSYKEASFKYVVVGFLSAFLGIYLIDLSMTSEMVLKELKKTRLEIELKKIDLLFSEEEEEEEEEENCERH